MNQPSPTSLARTVPKAELHCHADAVIDAAMLRTLDPAFLRTPLAPEELEALCPARSWEDWLNGYAARIDAVMTRELFLASVQAHVRRWREQQVVYAELMISGWLQVHQPEETTIAFFRDLRRAIDEAAEGRLPVNLLVALSRGPRAALERRIERVLALRRAGLITGLGLAGDEGACTVASIHDLLDRAREAGLGIEIHAGERLGPDSVREALEWGRPDRLGHGLAAFEDPRLLDEIQRRGIHLEFCPTSNRLLTPYVDIRSHPLVRAHSLGLSYSVNTDDPAPFGCSLTSEFELLERDLGFTEADFGRILQNTRRAAFDRR
ncbi:MAG: Adenosine deaminase [Candidatus Ozemobacter sibiricus]|uniref:Adenosine deaminase n=1 Tax=Candidatus Ozemobacter sibiricus TaxID=2268124 RepID=A0A367ZUU1_9BACT|nr:MAG: Adenosine deaminase [Candidatus Ozemobacter sibiricus]